MKYTSTWGILTSKLNLYYTDLQLILALKRSKRYLAFCSTGYRSIIAVSILRASGINAVDVFGGFAAASVYAPDLTTSGKVLLIHRDTFINHL